MSFQQPENHFRQTLQKTKPTYELRQKIMENNHKSEVTEIIPKKQNEKIKNKSAFMHKSQESSDESRRNQSERRKEGKVSCKSIKRRIYVTGGKRRRSMMGYERTGQGKRCKKSKNQEFSNIKQEELESSINMIRVKSNEDLPSKQKEEKEQEQKQEESPNKAFFNENGIERKLLNSLVSSQFLAEKDIYKSQSFTENINKNQKMEFMREKMSQFYTKLTEYLTKHQFEKYFNLLEQKIQKCEDMHHQKCANKIETKKAINYLEKKINRFCQSKGGDLSTVNETEEDERMNVSRCLACNRIFPFSQQKQKVQSENKESKQKKVVYYGTKATQVLPSTPLSLNKWKRRTAEMLGSGNILFKKGRVSKIF